MVEHKNGTDDGSSDDSPPLVQAEATPIVSLDTLEPISVSVVTIDGDGEPMCPESSVLSNDLEDSTAAGNKSSLTCYAGIAGGVVGTLVAGPVVGLMAGGAAAYYSQHDGAAGDITRAMGEVAMTTGAKARELNEKHNLVDRSKDAADAAWRKVKEVNQEHSVADRSKVAATSAWENLKEFDRKHNVASKLKEIAVLCFQQILILAEYTVNRLREAEAAGRSRNGSEVAERCVQPVGQSKPTLVEATAY